MKKTEVDKSDFITKFSDVETLNEFFLNLFNQKNFTQVFYFLTDYIDVDFRKSSSLDDTYLKDMLTSSLEVALFTNSGRNLTKFCYKCQTLHEHLWEVREEEAKYKAEKASAILRHHKNGEVLWWDEQVTVHWAHSLKTEHKVIQQSSKNLTER